MGSYKSTKMVDENWKTNVFRQNVVAKLEQAVINSGIHSRNSVDMENHIFHKTTNKEDYLRLIAKLILHFNNLKKKQGKVVAGSGQRQVQNMGPQPGQLGGPQQTTTNIDLLQTPQLQMMANMQGNMTRTLPVQERRNIGVHMDSGHMENQVGNQIRTQQMQNSVGSHSSSRESSDDTDAGPQELDSGDEAMCDIESTPKSPSVSQHALADNGNLYIGSDADLSRDFTPYQYVPPNNGGANPNIDVNTIFRLESIPKLISPLKTIEPQSGICLESDLCSPRRQPGGTSTNSSDTEEQTQTQIPVGNSSSTLNNSSVGKAKQVERLTFHQPTVSNATEDEAGPLNSHSKSDGALTELRLKRLRRNKKAYTTEKLKRLYFKKKLEVAQFELHSKKVLHKLECSIKRRQLENIC